MEATVEILEEEKLEISESDAKETEEVYKKAFPRVASFVGKMGGSFDDAKDIFHDALVIFFEMTLKKDFRLFSSEEAYILGISKHLWTRKYKKSRLNVPLNKLEKEIIIPEDYFHTAENNRLLQLLEKAGKKCLDLLRAFYYEQLPIKKLANKLGFTSEHSASVQKYKCLEKVRETVKENSLTYEDFAE